MSARHAFLLAALAAIWGGSYLLIKYGLEDLEPGVIVWARCALAALVLFAVLALRNGGSEARAALAELRARPGRALLMGFLAIALPFTLITFGELEVPSGLTAVLIAPASLFVAAFAPFIDRSEGVQRSGLLGMVMGVVGVALLVGIESVQSLGEFLTVTSIVGLALILGGVALASGQRRAVASRVDGPDPLAAGDGVPRSGARLARAQPSRADA